MKTSDQSSVPQGAESRDSHSSTKRRWWPILRRLLTIGFFVLVAWLLISHARSVDWQQVKDVLAGYSPLRIAVAMALAICAFIAYSCFDLFGRHYVGHGISKRKTMAAAFVSYAFNLNLGAIVGSVGMRYRLYSRMGVSNADIAHIFGLSVSTNWLGYLLLAGITFASGAIAVPDDWKISSVALQVLGVGFIAVTMTYLALCRFSPKRTLMLRGYELTLPSTRIAIAQFVNACTHWLLMGSIIYTFLYTEIDFFSLFGVLLISAIAGAVTHIPGALGVLEGVFIMLLGGQVGESQLIGALIAYRAVFYLFPLLIALVTYLFIEIGVNKARNDSDAVNVQTPN